MSCSWQSRNVAFCSGLSRVPVKRRRALLRNSLHGDQMQPQFACLCQKPVSFPLLITSFLILENRRVVLQPVCDQMVDDTGQFVCNGSNGFRRTEARFHSAEILPEKCLAF